MWKGSAWHGMAKLTHLYQPKVAKVSLYQENLFDAHAIT